MSYFTPGGGSVQANASGATNPTVQNISMLIAGTEYSVTVLSGTRRFEVRSRSLGTLQLAYISGNSGTIYRSIPAGCAYIEEDLLLVSNLLIYVQSTKPNDTLEVVSWA